MRISVLWQRVQALHRRFPFDSKIDVLTANMLSPTSPTPKMKCYGAECRGLVPVVRQLSEGLLDPAGAMDRSVKAATDSLASSPPQVLRLESGFGGALTFSEQSRSHTSFKNCVSTMRLVDLQPTGRTVKKNLAGQWLPWHAGGGEHTLPHLWLCKC